MKILLVEYYPKGEHKSNIYNFKYVLKTTTINSAAINIKVYIIFPAENFCHMYAYSIVIGENLTMPPISFSQLR